MNQLLRYGAVGLANTAIGFGLIWLCLSLGIDDYPANAVGYAAGLTFSFFANRHFTFGLEGRGDRSEMLRFGLCVAVAYAANLLVIAGGREAGLAGAPALHLAGMVTYSALFFVLVRSYAFALPVPAGLRASFARYLPALALLVIALAALGLAYVG